jgi:predicted DNA binding protein
VISINNQKKNIYIIKGSDENVEKFFHAMEILWELKDIKIQKLEYKECDILSKLTNNQKKILNSAKKFGYYDYPRKITCEELSEKIGVKKDITLESLRKAEKRIFTKILAEN